MNELERGDREWLETAAGHAYAAQHGGPHAAIAEMQRSRDIEDVAVRGAVAEWKRARGYPESVPAHVESGFRHAVRGGIGGPQLAGSTQDVVRELAKFDPAWQPIAESGERRPASPGIIG